MTPKKVNVFFIDEQCRTLTEKSMHKLLSETFTKARPKQKVEAVAASAPEIHDSEFLYWQIFDRDLDYWEVVYFHDSKKYPPCLLGSEAKIKLPDALKNHNGKNSAEVIYELLQELKYYAQFEETE